MVNVHFRNWKHLETLRNFQSFQLSSQIGSLGFVPVTVQHTQTFPIRFVHKNLLQLPDSDSVFYLCNWYFSLCFSVPKSVNTPVQYPVDPDLAPPPSVLRPAMPTWTALSHESLNVGCVCAAADPSGVPCGAKADGVVGKELPVVK